MADESGSREARMKNSKSEKAWSARMKYPSGRTERKPENQSHNSSKPRLSSPPFPQENMMSRIRGGESAHKRVAVVKQSIKSRETLHESYLYRTAIESNTRTLLFRRPDVPSRVRGPISRPPNRERRLQTPKILRRAPVRVNSPDFHPQTRPTTALFTPKEHVFSVCIQSERNKGRANSHSY